jgi:hypothetical protein
VGGVANPLALTHSQAQWAATGGRQSALYDMLNVKYVLVRDGTPLPAGKFELALDAPGELSVYRTLAFRPRAWIVHQATLATDMENGFAQIQAEGFDPAQQVVLAGPAEDFSPFGPIAEATGPESATVTEYGSSRMSLEVEATAPGYLVLSEVWYPGWQATVNGEPVQVIPANGALRAVPIPAGASTVELWFAPRAWTWGLILAGVGLVISVALIWLGRRR